MVVMIACTFIKIMTKIYLITKWSIYEPENLLHKNSGMQRASTIYIKGKKSYQALGRHFGLDPEYMCHPHSCHHSLAGAHPNLLN